MLSNSDPYFVQICHQISVICWNSKWILRVIIRELADLIMDSLNMFEFTLAFNGR